MKPPDICRCLCCDFRHLEAGYYVLSRFDVTNKQYLAVLSAYASSKINAYVLSELTVGAPTHLIGQRSYVRCACVTQQLCSFAQILLPHISEASADRRAAAVK